VPLNGFGSKTLFTAEASGKPLRFLSALCATAVNEHIGIPNEKLLP
jgi:hypothetical protein